MSHKICVRVLEARSLKPSDFNGWSDPYCKLFYGKKKFGKTKYIKRTLNPNWDESFTKIVDVDFNESIKVEIYDHDTIGDDFLGQTTIPLELFQDGKWSQKWYRLMDEEDLLPSRGYVHLKMQVVPIDCDTFGLNDRRPNDEVTVERKLRISQIPVLQTPYDQQNNQ